MLIQRNAEFPSYFAVGPLRHPELIKAITGRRPDGLDATLDGYQLWEQKLKDIPEPVRTILGRVWGESFIGHGIYEMPGSAVTGKIWFLTAEEYELIQSWHFVPDWLSSIEVEVRAPKIRLIECWTDVIPRGQSLTRQLPVLEMITFPNGREKTFEKARLVRP